ncbi:MAG: ZIP family metal transporter [Sphingobacteriales bacterium]|jgi:zinc and cadmium transporter|nr:ZIP family metal transporter [Sphingobacteriales bacterium]
MELLDYIILFVSAFLGGSLIFLIKTDLNKKLKLLLSFSGAYLFSITVLHLLPDVYSTGNAYIGLFILAGFGFQIFLEQYSEGIEHGHIHVHTHRHVVFPFGIMISLSLHAFLEGMPLVNLSGGNHHENTLLYGIALHHIPAAFALTSVLYQNKLKKHQVLFFLVLFAAMTPLGSLTSNVLQRESIGMISNYFQYMMGIVIGIFLHISTTILFESNVDHRFNFYKMIAIIVGASLAIINFLINV